MDGGGGPRASARSSDARARELHRRHLQDRLGTYEHAVVARFVEREDAYMYQELDVCMEFAVVPAAARPVDRESFLETTRNKATMSSTVPLRGHAFMGAASN